MKIHDLGVDNTRTKHRLATLDLIMHKPKLMSSLFVVWL